MPSATDLRDQLQAALGDGYRIERELPPGGMSRLFLASEVSLDRQVVIKVLPPELTTEVSAARFQREITVAAQLQHPHILPILSAGASGSLLYYVMPYVNGESLRHRLTREGRLPVDEAVGILTETADALARAHRAGVVHRDIKPENVLLQDGHALLADFGIARALRQATNETPITQGGGAPGTPAYMAPEQLAGDDKVDGRTDVYALAVVGYEMLAGISPFAGPTPQAIAAAHFKSAPRPLAAIRPDVPRRVSDAISRALESDPQARFATAAEFKDALVGGATPTGGQGRVVAVLATIVAAVVIIAMATFAWQRRGADHRKLDPAVVAVEPFTVFEPSLAIWREGMVDVLAHNLDGAGPLRTVAPTTIVHHSHGANTDPVALARSLGAGFAVTGRVERSGQDSVRVSATLVDVATGRPQDEVTYRGATDHMDWITDSVSVGILRSISRTEPVGVARGSLGGARSLPALKWLLESEQAYRRADWAGAEAAAERAIQLDSNFALAYYWAGSARGWIAHAGDSMASVYSLRAQALNHGLSPRDSLLVAANAILETPEHDVSATELQQIFDVVEASTHRYPDDPQIWANLGEIRFHLGFGRRFGVSPERALEPFARAIAIDSDFAPAYEHATRLAFAYVGRDAGLSYAYRFLRFNPPPPFGSTTRLQISLYTAPRDTAAHRRITDSMDPRELVYAIRYTTDVYDSAESSTWIASQLVQRVGPTTRTDHGPAVGYLLNALLNRGHVRALWSRIGPFETTFSGPAAMLAVVGDAGITPTATLDSILRSRDNLQRGYSWFGLRWWAGRGDTAAIRAFLAARTSQVARTDSDPPVNPAAYDTAAARAYLALAKGDTAEALRRFAQLPDTLCHGGCALDAITYGELMTSRGQAAAAESLLDRRYEIQEGTVTNVLQDLALARAASRAGDTRTAHDAYDRVADAWANADAELQPVVSEARAALARTAAQ
jgi:eukaryotic-like serine/threonine-protein kinase